MKISKKIDMYLNDGLKDMFIKKKLKNFRVTQEDIKFILQGLKDTEIKDSKDIQRTIHDLMTTLEAVEVLVEYKPETLWRRINGNIFMRNQYIDDSAKQIIKDRFFLFFNKTFKIK